MINQNIEEIFQILSVELGKEHAKLSSKTYDSSFDVRIDRVDQVAEKAKYPYGTYRLGSIKRVPTKSAFYKDEIIDSTKFQRTEKKRASVFISFSILHEKSLATALALADFAMEWFDSEDGTLICESKGITPTLISDAVDDRTVVFDNSRYDYKAGFDLNFQFYRSKESEIPIMQPPTNDSIQFEEEEN